MAIVHLCLLGGLEIRNSRGETIDLHVKKVMALFAYLAVQPETHFLREDVAQIFWPNATSKHSRHSLRQALADLRKHLPEFEDVFNVTYNTINIIPGSLSVDVLDYIDAAKRYDRVSQEKAFQLYRGPFLNGFSLRSEPFSIWHEETSLNLHERYIQVVEFQAEQNLLQGKTDKAIELNNKLIALDPIRESAYRCLMSLYANSDQPGAVDAQYEHCCSMLKQQLNTEPEERTIRCYQRIKQQFETKSEQVTKNNDSSANLIHPVQTAREKELLHIASLLKSFNKNQQGHCILVSGDIGIGKSWLLERSCETAEQIGLTTACTRFFDIENNYEDGIRDLLIEIVRPGPTVPHNTLPDIIADRFFKNSAKYDIYLAILCIIFKLPLPKRCQRTYSMLSPGNRERLHAKIIVDLLCRAAMDDKLILVFDDIHHANPMAFSILKSLVQTAISNTDSPTKGIFLILTCDQPDLIQEHIDKNSLLTSIALEELSLSEIKQFFSLKSGEYNNNLLYLNWATRLEKMGSFDYQDDLNSVLYAVISQLDSENQHALQACAVLGMRFSPDALNSLIDNPHFEPDNLISAGFLIKNRQLLEFSHFLTQQYVYQQIDIIQRKLLHSRAASYYLFGNSHLHACHLEASDNKMATNAYISAAIAASNEYRLDFATYFFEKALKCARTNQDKYFTAMQEGEALLGSERVSNAIQSFGQAQHLSNDPQQQAHAWLGMAIGLIQRKQYLAAKGLLDRCEPVLVQNHIPENPDHKPPYHETLAKYYYYRSLTAIHTSSIENAMRFNKIAFEHARQYQSSYWITNIALLSASLEMDTLYLTTAYSSLELAIRTARENNYGYIELQALVALAHVKLLQADFSGSVKDLEYVMTMASLVEDHQIMLDVLSVLCFSDFVKGQFSHLQKHTDLASELYQTIESPKIDDHFSNYKLLVSNHLDRHENIKNQITINKSFASQLRENQPIENLLWSQASIMALIEDNANEAIRHLEKAIRKIQHLTGPSKLECCFISIEAAIKHRLWEQAENLADILIMSLHDEPLPLFVMCAERVRILSRIDQGQITHTTRAELVDILASSKHYGLAIHLPAYENALEALRHGKETI